MAQKPKSSGKSKKVVKPASSKAKAKVTYHTYPDNDVCLIIIDRLIGLLDKFVRLCPGPGFRQGALERARRVDPL